MAVHAANLTTPQISRVVFLAGQVACVAFDEVLKTGIVCIWANIKILRKVQHDVYDENLAVLLECGH